MESVASFKAPKAGKAYVVNVTNLHPDGKSMLFHVDSGASVTFLGLNSFCDREDAENYRILKSVDEAEIANGRFEGLKSAASTATDEKVEMYPCKCSGVSISETTPVTLYFCIYLGDIGMPLLGLDYIDDCSYHHSIGGELMISAVANDVGKRFYPEKVIDFNKVLEIYSSKRIK